ncbi:MAG: hypothetical protein GY839_01740 [candidate division Zixibacteria bacterium]|nr:hypothetical protein [candidate division Zixibacteria bacterium]
MLKPTLFTWILVIFGAIFIFIPMLYAQLLMALKPHSQKSKDILIGEGQDWRDKTHFRSAYGLAWADLIIWLPSIAVGSIGVLIGYPWGYVLWALSGAISVYINIVLWFSEREYVYPSKGPWIYFSYYWGFFVYWGLAAVIYSISRLVEVEV